MALIDLSKASESLQQAKVLMPWQKGYEMPKESEEAQKLSDREETRLKEIAEKGKKS